MGLERLSSPIKGGPIRSSPFECGAAARSLFHCKGVAGVSALAHIVYSRTASRAQNNV